MNEAINEAEAKYSFDGPFKEPVVKCDSCQEILLRQRLQQTGKCPHCGNTRVRNVNNMTEADAAKAKKWAEEGLLDADWLTLFEANEVDA